jgi:hypothetical protein
VHVDAAAYAALLAVSQKVAGVFNIVELEEQVTAKRALAELGWNANFRLPF